MTRFRAGCTALLVLAFVAACAKDAPSGGEQIVAPDARTTETSASGGSNSDDDSDDRSSGSSDNAPRRPFVAIRDDCDPRDPAWNPTGGCLLRRGNVTFAEFARELDSPLALAVVGHQAWRNDPTYLVVERGTTIRVKNEGGRVHTFTKVAAFGGGKVPNPALNEGLITAPECPTSVDVPPGSSIRISGLAPGDHRFECCIHPWMRALITVKAK
jgi:plastocyanin